MTDRQARLIGSALVVIGGGIAALSSELGPNIPIAVLLLGTAMFIVEYLRSLQA